jgi:CRISPR-associated protein Cas6
MYWEEDPDDAQAHRSPRMQDAVFRIQCRQLPVDHAHALQQGLTNALNWLPHEPLAAIHPIFVAGSQNGWNRPAHSPDERIHLSRRTRLILRLPLERMENVTRLSGRTLQINGHNLLVGDMQRRDIKHNDTLFSRYLVCLPEQTEEAFLHDIAMQLRQLGVNMRKALCGRTQVIHTPDGPVFSRSLMIASLKSHESMALQQQGLGQHRLLGCGIFIPHKGIDAINKAADDGSAQAG